MADSLSSNQCNSPAAARFALAAALLTIFVPFATAEPSEPRFRINGYGTVGVTHASEDSADFSTSPLHVPDGAGHTDSWSPKVDSRLALQVEAHLLDRIDGVIQLISEQQYDGRFTPTFEWAYLRLEATPDVAVKAGRIVLPVLITSGYRKVGYATPWIRPPQEVYQLVPVSQFDGLDAVWSTRAGDATNSLQLAAGTSEHELVGGFHYDVKRSLVVNNTIELGALTLFASFSDHRLVAKGPKEFEHLMAVFSPQTVGDNSNNRLLVTGAGFRYDSGTWLAMAEWMELRGKLSGNSDGWYFTTGYRFGALMPYVTLASQNVRSRPPGIERLPLDGSLPLDSATVSLLALNTEQKRASIGVRWDLYPKVAIKVEYDHIDLKDNATGFRNNLQPDFRRGEDYSVFSAAVDFLF